jgi:hypothetical protein
MGRAGLRMTVELPTIDAQDVRLEPTAIGYFLSYFTYRCSCGMDHSGMAAIENRARYSVTIPVRPKEENGCRIETSVIQWANPADDTLKRAIEAMFSKG